MLTDIIDCNSHYFRFEHDQFVLQEDATIASNPLHQIIEEYCKNSSIHGVKHLSNRKNNRIEKLFWLFGLIVSFLFFIFLFSKVWIRYGDGPIAIEISPYQKPIWDIPFPAITICTETKSKSSEFQFKNVFQRITPRQPITSLTPDEYEFTFVFWSLKKVFFFF